MFRHFNHNLPAPLDLSAVRARQRNKTLWQLGSIFRYDSPLVTLQGVLRKEDGLSRSIETQVVTSRVLFVALLVCVWNSGCIRRVLMVRSEPEGAVVTIDRQTVGQTPVAVPFTYYGTREIRLEKDGFETLETKERIRAPWYDIAPLSFFTAHFSLRERRDVRQLDYRLTPKQTVDENELLIRAGQLRTDVARGTVTMPMDPPQ